MKQQVLNETKKWEVGAGQGHSPGGHSAKAPIQQTVQSLDFQK